MFRLIETDAPAGSIIEHQGRDWRVLGPSEWPGEAECRDIDSEIAERDAERAAWSTDERAVADALMAAAEGDQVMAAEPDDDDCLTAMLELEALGLWEIHGLDPIDKLRARVRAADAELRELQGRG